jgi:superfamily II DNA or RNA helicase
MISETIRSLKRKYKNQAGEKIGRDLIQPCLKEAIKYRRGTGTFSSSAFKAYVGAIDHFINDDVKIEILCSPKIDYNLLKILEKSQTEIERIKILQKTTNDLLLAAAGCRAAPNNQDYRSTLLAYLIAKNKLEIKIALPLNSSEVQVFNSPEDEDLDFDMDNVNTRAMYHIKYGYFLFPDKSIVAFEGSVNETDTALNFNTEKATVYRSWEEKDGERLNDVVEDLDNDWEGRNNDIRIYNIDDDTLKIIRDQAPTNRPKDPKKINPAPPPPPVIEEDAPTNNTHAGITLWPHQVKALSEWKNNEYKGILAMATGSGKTRTAIAAIKEFKNKYKTALVVVVVPKINLANQWVEELARFGVNCLEAYTGHSWYQKINSEILNLSITTLPYDIPCIVVVKDTMNSEKFQDRLKELNNSNESINNLIVVDECHHYNNKDAIKNLPDFFKSRLGLSATPFNQYEEEPDAQFLNSYFGHVVYEYLLGDAIKDEFLTPYNYYVVPTYLNDEESEDLERIDAEIGAMYNAAKNDSSYQANLDILNAEKNRLLGSVKDKLIKLDSVIGNGRKYNALAYCGASSDEDTDGLRTRHISRVSSIFEKKGWLVGKITSDESIRRREEIIKDLESEVINVVVSIKVLDEGIDIPCCTTAYILASSKSNREFIQRRGRVLRRHANKEYADIYDFVILGGQSKSKAIDKVVKEEFYRVNEFAKLALNKNSIYVEYKKELEDYE